jgi:hypothetical protein
MQAISESFDGKTVDLSVGQVIELRLKENPTTGFRWQLRRDGTPACRITEDFIEPATTERAPVPGRGSTHVWHVVAYVGQIWDPPEFLNRARREIGFIRHGVASPFLCRLRLLWMQSALSASVRQKLFELRDVEEDRKVVVWPAGC